MRRIPATVLSLVSLLAVFAPSASANPIQVTSGIFTTAFGPTPQRLDGEDLVLIGAGLQIFNSLEDPVAFLLLTHPPVAADGAVTDFSGVLHIEDALGGFAGGMAGLVNAPFELSFHATPAAAACDDQPFTQCTVTTRFTMSADLTFTPLNGDPFTQPLVGSGTAAGQLFRSTDAGDFAQVTFNFAPVATPEPATLLLFTAGAFGIRRGGLRARRKR